MGKKDSFTKSLAMAGTVLAWLPILAPIMFSAGLLTRERIFRFDYLMPAELFPAVLVGGCLLLATALRARSRRGLIGGSLGAAAATLVGSQGLAIVTGLASGRTATGGWQWALVLGLLALYVLALVVIGVGGVLLLTDLFRTTRAKPV